MKTVIEQLNQARRETEQQLHQIKTAITILGGTGHAQRQMSPEARQRIAEAQKARWAKFRRQQRKAA